MWCERERSGEVKRGGEILSTNERRKKKKNKRKGNEVKEIHVNYNEVKQI